MFGAIKDISISNIHANESDKTKDFLSKDLAAIFAGWEPEDYEETTKSSTASAPVSIFQHPPDTLSSSEEEMALLPLPELHIVSSSDCLDQEGNNHASLSQGSGYAKRPLTLDTTAAIKKSDPDFDGHANKMADNRKHLPVGSASTLSKGRGNVHAYSSSGSKGLNEDKNSNLNWTQQKSREKRCLPSRTIGSEDKGQKISPKLNAEDVSLLEIAENLLQMTADVHSRIQEVKKGTEEVPEDSRFISPKTKTQEASERCIRKEKHTSCRLKENARSKHTRSSVGSHKLLGKDKETRILCHLPKSAWSLYRDEADSNDEKPYSFDGFLDSSHWSLNPQRHSSSNYLLQHPALCDTFSGQSENGAISDVDCKKHVKNERDQSAKGARKKYPGKSKKGKHKPQAVAVMSDGAGYSHAVSGSTIGSHGLSPVANDVLQTSSDCSKSAVHTREPVITLSPKADNLSMKSLTRELEEDEYASRVRESASSMFPLLPSPPPPAPSSPSLQVQDDYESLSEQNQSANFMAESACPTRQNIPQNVIKYSLRRNIDSGSLQVINGNNSYTFSNRNEDETEACVSEAVDFTVNSSVINPEAVASALTTLDHYETSMSDGDNWEDASASLPREEKIGLIRDSLEVVSEDIIEAKDLDSVYV